LVVKTASRGHRLRGKVPESLEVPSVEPFSSNRADYKERVAGARQARRREAPPGTGSTVVVRAAGPSCDSATRGAWQVGGV
jgi:hypothetical protein